MDGEVVERQVAINDPFNEQLSLLSATHADPRHDQESVDVLECISRPMIPYAKLVPTPKVLSGTSRRKRTITGSIT